MNLESWANGEARPRRALRLDAKVQDRKLTGWKVEGLEASSSSSGVAATEEEEIAKAALIRNFEFRLPLSWLIAVPSSAAGSAPVDHAPAAAAIPPTSRLRLRFSLWQNRLPVDALPVEGWIELHLVSEAELGLG